MSSNRVTLIAIIGSILCVHGFKLPLPSVDAPNALLATGGINGGELHSTFLYNASANGWIPRAPMTIARILSASTTLDNAIYAIGGGDYDSPLKSCERYSPATNEWKAIRDMETPRSCVAAVAFNGSIVAFGGYQNRGPIASVEQYVVSTYQWRSFPSLNKARYCPAGAVLGECIYAIGGFGKATAEAYCASTHKWHLIAPMKVPRFGHGAAAIGGFLYVCGGVTSPGQYTSSCERYDPAKNSWTNVSPMPCTARAAFGMANLRGKIFIAGGYDGQSLRDDVFYYDPLMDKWHAAKKLLKPTSALSLAPLHA